MSQDNRVALMPHPINLHESLHKSLIRKNYTDMKLIYYNARINRLANRSHKFSWREFHGSRAIEELNAHLNEILRNNPSMFQDLPRIELDFITLLSVILT